MSDIHTIVTSVCEAHGCNDQGLMGDLIRKLTDFVTPPVAAAPPSAAATPPVASPKGSTYTPKGK